MRAKPFSGSTRAAPAPSPKRMAVFLPSGVSATRRDMISAPTTNTRPMAGASRAANASPMSDPAEATGISRAGVEARPSAAAIWLAGPGQKRSLDPLATRIKPRSAAVAPAFSRQSRAASRPMPATVSSSAA